MMKKILAAATDQQLLGLLIDKLPVYGFDVEIAIGNAVIRQLQRTVPDVLIIDFILDNNNAAAICHQIKSDPATRNLPIIILSDFEGVEQIAGKLGTYSVLQKPVALIDLVETIYDALQVA